MQTETEFTECDCARGGGYPGCSEFWRLKKSGEPDAAQAHREAAVKSERDARRDAGNDANWVVRLERMHVPASAIVALRAPQENACLLAAKKFLTAPREVLPALVLIGPTGLGKTVAAAYVLRDFAKRFDWNGQPTGITIAPAIFLPARRLSRLSTFDAADRELYENARRTKVLVLDDLGDEAHDFAKAQLVDLLMERLDAGRALVLTSNLSAEAFRKRYGEALFDRIRARSIVPALSGKTLREKREARP